MITHINVKNFKSFLEANFEISNLNLFTGVNGVGKSTLIQVLLLLHQSYLRKGSQYAGELFLNGELISLGTGNDVRAQSADASGILLEVLAEEYEVSLNYLVEPTSGIKENKFINDDDTDLLIPNRDHTFPEVADKHSLFNNNFVYLSADRIIPNTSYSMGSFDEVYKQRNFGNKGEFALQYLDRVSNYSTESIIIPSHESAEDDSIRYNVTAWMGEISPGVNIEFNLFENIGKMGLSYNFDDVVGPVRNFKPTNVGFGLTYVLPVVISLLTAKKGDIIIIENPEAHLHPRGQSRMGKLISEVANAGVQVFVETHSDHVLNGIRVATKNNKIEADKVKIYYFDRSDESYKQYHATKAYQLKLDQNGNIDKWPDGFFDEWDNMLDELM